MSIHFAAVHSKNPWRTHTKHDSLHNAIDGKDGAKNLLRRIGRVSDMWTKYGDVYGVFVWEDGEKEGQLFRLDTYNSDVVHTAIVPTEAILGFHRRKKCGPHDIVLLFGDVSENEDSPSTEAETRDTLSNFIFPDELPDSEPHFSEGSAMQVLVNRYERSEEARNACIKHFGTKCQACRLEFSDKYGSIGREFIHVHHKTPLSEVGKDYRVDPIDDLVPVCPNCHAMIHRRSPPLSIAELREMIHWSSDY